MIVRSSDAQTLALYIYIVEPGESESDDQLILSRTEGSLRLATEETPICSEQFGDFQAVIDFEASVFQLPQGAGASFALDIEAMSAPET